jgi:hypothetical protein
VNGSIKGRARREGKKYHQNNTQNNKQPSTTSTTSSTSAIGNPQYSNHFSNPRPINLSNFEHNLSIGPSSLPNSQPTSNQHPTNNTPSATMSSTSAYYELPSTRPSFDSKVSASSQSSTDSTSSMSKAWKAVKKHAKEHHESVNGAYATYYGAGTSAAPLVTLPVKYVPKESFETERTAVNKESVSNAKKAWQAVKKHAKEHHASVNAAYGTYYGGSPIRA